MPSEPERHIERISRVGQHLLFAREQIDLGEWSIRTLRGMVERGELVRVARGAYMRTAMWRSFFADEQLLAATLAQAGINRSRGWIFTHESAAALWGLPLWALSSLRVHVATDPARPARSSARVVRRLCVLGDEDVIEIAGIRCTSLARTVVDLARSPVQERAIGVADAGLRQMFPGVRGSVPDAARAWQGEQLQRLRKVTGPGVRSARRIIALADTRADSPAESVSRLQLTRLGVPTEIQVPIFTGNRSKFWVDFEFVGQGVLGEIDGKVKYLDAAMRGGASAEEIVLAEKSREDEIRGLTGKRIVRWQVEHVRSARALGERLKRFNVVVPGV